MTEKRNTNEILTHTLHWWAWRVRRRGRRGALEFHGFGGTKTSARTLGHIVQKDFIAAITKPSAANSIVFGVLNRERERRRLEALGLMLIQFAAGVAGVGAAVEHLSVRGVLYIPRRLVGVVAAPRARGTPVGSDAGRQHGDLHNARDTYSVRIFTWILTHGVVGDWVGAGVGDLLGG